MLCKVTDPDGLCILCPFQVKAAQATGCFTNSLFQVGCASYAPPPVPVVSFLTALREHCPNVWKLISGQTLLANVNHPRSQEDVVSNWGPAHTLAEDVVSGAEIAVAPLPSASGFPHLPLPPGREGH